LTGRQKAEQVFVKRAVADYRKQYRKETAITRHWK